MKKKLRVITLLLVAALAVTLGTPAMTAWAEDDGGEIGADNLIDPEGKVKGGGGSGSTSPGVNGTLNNSAIVVRGGTSTATNLKINQASDSRGYISANSGNGASLSTLATTPSAFPNGQISVTTVGEIRAIGMNVIPDSTSSNPYHVAIVPNSNPLSDQDANALSNVFNQQSNTWR